MSLHAIIGILWFFVGPNYRSPADILIEINHQTVPSWVVRKPRQLPKSLVSAYDSILMTCVFENDIVAPIVVPGRSYKTCHRPPAFLALAFISSGPTGWSIILFGRL